MNVSDIEDALLFLLRKKAMKAAQVASFFHITKHEANSVLYRLQTEGKCELDRRWMTWKATKPEPKPKMSPAVVAQQRKQAETKKAKPTEKAAPKPSKSPNAVRLQTKTKMKMPTGVPYKPKSSRAEDLFEYAVKTLAQKSQTRADIFEPKMHNQWHNYCFNYSGFSSDTRSEYMSIIKSTYSAYFLGKLKYTFDIKAIERDFPQYFSDYDASNDDMLAEIERAVKSELEFARKPQNKEKYKVASIERSSNGIYRLTLNLRDDEEPHFYEGIKIKLVADERFFDCVGLDYDMAQAMLSVSSENPLPVGNHNNSRIFLDSSFILEAMCEMVGRLRGLGNDARPINKFLNGRAENLREIADANIPLLVRKYGAELDKSQQGAFAHTLGHDITFIWGPPGTGKSHTLASILRALYALSENTVVCCISNVAVDQLLNKVIDVLEKEHLTPAPCEIYRAGFTLDKRLLSTDYLFPKDNESMRLRDKIKDLNSELEKMKQHGASKEESDQELILKKERLAIVEKLKTHTAMLIGRSKLVFSTIAGFILSPQLRDREFQNLVVDEASMLSMPYLFSIAQRTFKRIILVGDPQQLGPISITPSKWLRMNVFDYCQVLATSHPALKKLLTQRRSHPSIVRLTNKVFYNGELNAIQTEEPQWVSSGPFAGKVVVAINPDTGDNAVRYVGPTRRNFGTKAMVMDILNTYHQQTDESFTIGIITPYRGQVKMYLGDIRDRRTGDGFWEKIKVGTIHTFQGSECDLILLDLVEKSPQPVSKLFSGIDGERLVNVALSRAKHKLIIVGDTQRFEGWKGVANVTTNTSKVLSQLPQTKI